MLKMMIEIGKINNVENDDVLIGKIYQSKINAKRDLMSYII